MSINYIDDNGVRQIFSDIKSNLDNINNTAVSAYDRANEAYTIASSGSITPSTQTFNIAGNKMFNIDNGYFNINSKNIIEDKSGNYIKEAMFVLGYNTFNSIVKSNTTASGYVNTRGDFGISPSTIILGVYSFVHSYISITQSSIYLKIFNGPSIQLTQGGIYLDDGKGNSGRMNVLNCM